MYNYIQKYMYLQCMYYILLIARLSGAGLGQLLSLEPIAEFPPTPRRSDSAVPPPDQTLPTIITSPTSLLARDLSHSLSVRSPSSSKPRSTGPAPCSGDDRPIRSRSCHRSGLERASDGVSGAAGESASLLEATGGKICSAASLMRFHSANHGLNSILDGSPLEGRARGNRGRGIRRPALRQFYGNSLASPNLSGVDDALCGELKYFCSCIFNCNNYTPTLMYTCHAWSVEIYPHSHVYASPPPPRL